jgi:hypothetical protein
MAAKSLGLSIGKGLGHQHHGLVAGAVAVRMEFAQHVPNGPGGFLVLGRRPQAELAHGVDDSALDGFQSVADERQRPVHNDVHGIIEVGGPHELRQRHPLHVFDLKGS